jgi:hypothetical protein
MLEVKPPRTPSRIPLGQLLVRSGLIDQDELAVALDRHRRTGTHIGAVIIELGLATERQVIQSLSRQLQIPSLDLNLARISPEVTRWVDVRLAERFRIFPVGADRERSLLRVATSDPTDVEALETLTAHSGMMVFFLLSDQATIQRTIRRYYHRPTTLQPPPLPVHARLAEVEQALKEQAMAVRSMLEVLDRKSLISRDEVLSRLMPAVRRPPPLPLRRSCHQRWLPLLRDDS